MSRSFLTCFRLFVLLTTLLLYVGPALSIPSPEDGRDDNKVNNKNDGKDDKKRNRDVIRVRKWESIQDAIDHAKPYTRIEIEGSIESK